MIAAGLGVGAVVLLVAAALTARPPDRVVAGSDEHLREWSALHAGIDPYGNGLVLWWLRVMRRVGAPIARAGVHPNALTAAGLWCALAAWAAAAAGARWALAATIAAAASGLADGLDGTVAVLSGRATAAGGVLDGLADRASDVVLLLALFTLEGSAAAVLAASGLLLALEYVRALAGRDAAAATLVTVGERPTRLILVAVALWCAGLWPAYAPVIATTGAAAVAVVSFVGLIQIGAALREPR